MIENCISMNEARVVTVHNSKSKRENLNVYIYCCVKNMSYQKKCHQKEGIKKEDHEIIATLKKNVLFVLIEAV